jgi:hypothetical protein
MAKSSSRAAMSLPRRIDDCRWPVAGRLLPVPWSHMPMPSRLPAISWRVRHAVEAP